ncbi:MAG: bifunctional folylpolyglutamate synthase/dihydrofolate synthase [Chloroflexi bacterium]|nr:Mur ligase family protein [Chloroflexota bacterium]MQC26021.1 bifunctional folylpolyglutamate synthase/dihydrofolate synthase [Chloroflexota bacterium]
MQSSDWDDVYHALDAYLDLSLQPQQALSAGSFSLDKIVKLLSILGNPEQEFPSFHIAGTNGKGSVSVLCAAAQQAGGYCVGLYTSPHGAGPLHGISVDNQAISPAQATALIIEVKIAAQQIPGLTRFELVTGLAFLYFARSKVDVAVIEVGLGGRLDATNVITPLVSVITPIDLEHRSILGKNLEVIAAHKAGIIKRGVPVVSAPQAPEVLGVLRATANAQAAQFIQVGEDVLYERLDVGVGGQRLGIWRPADPDNKVDLEIKLIGAHQAQNAATAYAALTASGLALDLPAIRAGFANANWPGRFELLQPDPPVVLDAAHTPAAAIALRHTLDELFPNHPLVVLIGVSADKDLAGLVVPLEGRLGSVIATQSSHPRAMPAEELATRLGEIGVEAQPVRVPADAFEIAMQVSAKGTLLLAFGSVFLVEQLRESWDHRG